MKMSVIIRLQNLPWSANALDIRNFFKGLSIPDGGVHIVGGEMGDAFIAFSTDEDARQAMMQDRGKINDVQVRLLLSSRAEMQKVIEVARQQSQAIQAKMSVNVHKVQPIVHVQKVQPIVQAPQPPIITPNALTSLLAIQSGQAYTSISQQHQKLSALTEIEPSGGVQHERDHRRSTSTDRRRSQSKDHSESGFRRKDRSRSRSRDRDADYDRKFRRLRRSRSRERSRDHRDTDRNENRPSHKGTQENDDTPLYRKDNNVEAKDKKRYDVPFNVWDVPPQNAYETSNYATYTSQPIAQAAYGQDPNLPLQTLTTKSMNSNYNSRMDSGVNELKMGAATASQNQYGTTSSHLNTGQLENKPTFAFQSTQAKVSSNSYNTNSLPQYNTANHKNKNPRWFESTNKTDAFGRNVHHRMDFSQRNNDQERSSAPDDEKNCIKITNMCPSTSYSDIRRFFSGLYIPNNGIKMINDEHGARIGTAFIRFVRAVNVPKALVRDGTEFKSKIIRLEVVTEAEFEAAVDSFKPSRHTRSLLNDNGRSSYDSGRSRDPKQYDDDYKESSPSNTNNISSVLLVKDIPPYSTQQDIMKIFSAYTLLDIVLTHKPDNRREMFAYVKFHKAADARAAYTEDVNHRINQRPVRVSMATEEEYEIVKEEIRLAAEKQLREQEKEELENKIRIEAEAKAQAEAEAEAKAKVQALLKAENHGQTDIKIESQENNQEDVIKIDLTSNCGEDNIDENHDEHPMDVDALPFVLPQPTEYDHQIDNFQNCNKWDFINASNSQHSNNQMNQYNGIPSLLDIPPPKSLLDVDVGRNSDPRIKHNRPSRFDNPDNQQPCPSKFIIIKNCEFKTSMQTVGEYFVSHDLVPVHVELLRNYRNQPCGEFIIEFQNNRDAESALNLNNSRFTGRTIRINLISPQQIADRINKPFMNCYPSNNSQLSPNNLQKNQQMREQFNNPNGNYSNNSTHNNQSEYYGDAQNQMQGPHRGRNYQNNNFRGNTNSVNQTNNRKRSRFSNNTTTGSNPLNPFKTPAPDMDRELQPSPIPDDEGNDNKEIPEKFKCSGCVLEMENVPYRADLQEIMKFFEGYNIQPDDIIRRYNDDGTPTGDARVAFSSAAEAKAAYEDKRNKIILGRTIYLNIFMAEKEDRFS